MPTSHPVSHPVSHPAPHPTGGDCGCPEFSRLGRRGLLRGAALVGTSMTLGSAVVTVAGASPAAAAAADTNTLVVLSLRGAADGLSLVVPHGDPVYYSARPSIAVPRESLLAADSFFGLHPALAPLLPLWQAGRLAAVHATGLPAPNRSHFAAMEEVEDADPGSSTRVGWLNRLIGADTTTSPLEGIALGTVLPTSLHGPASALSLPSLAASLAGDPDYQPGAPRATSLGSTWKRVTSPMGAAMRATLAATPRLATATAQPDRSASYGGSDLGDSLSTVARLVKARLGIEAVTVDQGDWDMHSGVGTPTAGRMVRNTTDLARALAAFFEDLGPLADRVTLVTISEFGRRVVQNGGAGLDHGWGNVMLLLGAGVRGGYHGTWPGLVNSLDADLAVTTDYRDVLAEVVATRTTASTATVFPGFTPTRVGAMTRL